MEIAGRIALVTGSARRLGRAIAAALADAGADVAIHHHASPDAAQEAAAELRAFGVRSRAFQADLTDIGAIDRLFERVEASFGGLDILVNSAAIFEHRRFLDVTPADWDRAIDLNLRAPFFCIQRAARRMPEGGAIVNIADVAAFETWTGYAPYSIAKAGLVLMTRLAARALGPAIRVNAVAPGSVLPPEDLSAEERERLARATALKRLGSPRDITEAVLFLVRSDYITGETLVVDGGKLVTG